MKSLIAKKIARDAHEAATDRARGLAPSFMKFAADTSVGLAIGNVRRLPTLANTTRLQDAMGNPIFLLDYSAFDAGDVLDN